MKFLLLCLPLICFLTSCSSLGVGDGQVDLTKVADQVALYRQDLVDVAPLTSPETQVKLAALDSTLKLVEEALRAGGAGGPISDVKSAAEAVLKAADAVLLALENEGGSVEKLRLYLVLVKSFLRHISLGQYVKAEEVVEQSAVEAF